MNTNSSGLESFLAKSTDFVENAVSSSSSY